MALIVIFSVLVNVALIHAGTELGIEPVFRPDNYTHFDVYASALSRAHYNPWVCDYRSEPGYKCISCSSALHCYPANFALLVQCAGIFPHCRNGYCSRFKTEGCTEEADPALASQSTMPPYVQVFNKGNKTTVAPNVSANHEITKPIINEPVLQENSKPVKKPKDSLLSPQISEEINSL